VDPTSCCFRNSGIVVCGVWVLETPKPWSPNSRNPKMRDPLSLFRISKNCLCLMFGFWSRGIPKPEIMKYWASLFRISKIGLCRCYWGTWTHEVPKAQNPEALVQPSLCFIFHRFVPMDVWPLYSRNPEVLVTFRDFGSCHVLILVVEFAKFQTPKSQKCGPRFAISWFVVTLVVVIAKSRTPKPWHASHFFCDFGSQCVLIGEFCVPIRDIEVTNLLALV
jgi:hypothetical protein